MGGPCLFNDDAFDERAWVELDGVPRSRAVYRLKSSVRLKIARVRKEGWMTVGGERRGERGRENESTPVHVMQRWHLATMPTESTKSQHPSRSSRRMEREGWEV